MLLMMEPSLDIHKDGRWEIRVGLVDIMAEDMAEEWIDNHGNTTDKEIMRLDLGDDQEDQVHQEITKIMKLEWKTETTGDPTKIKKIIRDQITLGDIHLTNQELNQSTTMKIKWCKVLLHNQENNVTADSSNLCSSFCSLLTSTTFTSLERLSEQSMLQRRPPLLLI